MNITYNVVKYLFDEGLLNLNKDVFTEPVIARTSVDIPLTAGYSAPAGSTPMPTDLVEPSDLDDEAWTPMYEVFEQIIEARKENEAKETEAAKCPKAGGTGGVQIPVALHMVLQLGRHAPGLFVEPMTGIEPAYSAWEVDCCGTILRSGRPAIGTGPIRDRRGGRTGVR